MDFTRRTPLVLTAALMLALLAVGAPPASAATTVMMPGPWGVTVNPATDTAYVSSRSANTLVSVNGSGTLGSLAPVGAFPLGTVYNPVNGYVYVADYSSGSVTVIDPVGMSFVATVDTTVLGAVGAHPYWVSVDTSTGNVIVSFYSAGAVIGVIDPLGQSLSTIALPAGESGDSHVGVAVDPIAHVAYVANATAGVVDVVPLNGTTPTTVPVGGAPAGIIYSAGKVYVGFAAGTVIKSIDTTSANAVASITVGNTPSGLAVVPPTKAVFSTNNGDGTLSVIDGALGTTVNTITPGTVNDYLTWAVADVLHSRLYVGNFTAGKVHVLAPADTEATVNLGLTRSASSVQAGDSVTYTATPSTGTQPVTFYDTTSGSTAISTCTNVALSAGTATCTVTYPTAGSYSVTAQTTEKAFLYKAASSPAATVTVTAVPVPPPVVPTTAPTTAPTTPVAQVPDAPADVRVSAKTSSTEVHFAEPAANGSPVTGYEYSLDGGTTWKTFDSMVDAHGSVSGTVPLPGGSSAYTLVFRAHNEIGPSGASEPVTVTPRAELRGPELGTTGGRVGTAYSARLSATGGLAPYTFSVPRGKLPAGLTLGRDGRLTGTPSGAGTSSATLRVTDADGETSDRTFSFDIERATAAGLPTIPRATLLRIPARPENYAGKKRLTKAWQASANGTDAYPVPRLRGLNLVKGQAATLTGDGLFRFDSGKLTATGRAQVRALAVTLRAEAKKVRCEGYTDYAGDRAHELALSRRRARAVCAALAHAQAGVSTASVGYGPAHPAVVGGNAKARKQNRRVVVLVTR